MKISGQLNGVSVELEKPEPVLRGGLWYEFVAYRFPKEGERFLNDCDGISVAMRDYTIMPHWIANEIPRASAEQLKAIGMHEIINTPIVCKIGDTIWQDNQAIHITAPHYPHIGKSRWVLENVPVEKEEQHTYANCGKYYLFCTTDLEFEPFDCLGCLHWIPRVEQSICVDCTTPAILCLWANEPKEKVKECDSKNTEIPVEEKSMFKDCPEYGRKGTTSCYWCENEQCPQAGLPVEKKSMHTSCKNCAYEKSDHTSPCNSCCNDGERKNYTPAAPPAPQAAQVAECHGCGKQKPLGQFPVDPAVPGLCTECNAIVSAPAPKDDGRTCGNCGTSPNLVHGHF